MGKVDKKLPYVAVDSLSFISLCMYMIPILSTVSSHKHRQVEMSSVTLRRCQDAGCWSAQRPVVHFFAQFLGEGNAAAGLRFMFLLVERRLGLMLCKFVLTY